jgi:hypothetical protein
MPALELRYIDELIELRRDQHGGGPGAPPVDAGYRQGTAVNRSCIVMMSAMLQAFVEDVFVDCSTRVLPQLNSPEAIKIYRDNFRRWGNPHPDNISRLFRRIGVSDVLANLNWQNCENKTMRRKLNDINEIGNQIAHGAVNLFLNKKRLSLSLLLIERYRRFLGVFGEHFGEHAVQKSGQQAAGQR